METTATSAATSARELNIKVKSEIAAAKAAAKADMKKEEFDVEKNAIGVKQHNTGKPKPKAGKEAPKAVAAKVVKPKLSEKIDELIEKGGAWADLIADAQKFCTDNELKSKITIGSFKTQIYWRRTVQHIDTYAADKVLTEKGIEKVEAPAKPKAKK